MLNRLVHKARAFLRKPFYIQLGFFPVWLLLGMAKALIFVVPFRKLAPRLGVHTGAAPWVPLLDTRQRARALSIGQLVRLTARYTPWDSNCFPQAIVARILLGLAGIPYALYFGLTHDGDSREMKAHAWVAADRVSVTGGNGFEQFTVVGCFVARGVQGGVEEA